MASTRQIARSAAPSAFSRTPSLAFQSHGRSPAYRRLMSTTIPATLNNTSRTSTFALSPLSPLKSPFLPETIAAVQARKFHYTPAYYEKQAKPADSAKSQDKAEEPASEAKAEEKAESDQDGKQQQQKEGKKSEEGEEGEEGEKKKKDGKEDLPPPPEHGDKTPWQVFMETMQTEFKASKEWNDSTKQLSDSAHQFQQSEGVKRARTAYEKSTGAVADTTGKVFKTSASAIGKSAAWTWDTSVMKGVRKGANFTGDALDKATKPIRDTEAYKNVKNVIDDGSSSRYGGWVEKEERRKAREAREQQMAQKPEDMVEDPNAGTNVTVHKDAAWREAWRDFRDQNKVVQGLFSMKDVYNESENPLISTARSITDRVAGFFAENESAMVIKKFRSMDPNFKLEPFLTELREYILPEVLDAYVKGDPETLKLWLSAAQYSVYEALTKQYRQVNMKSDGRILDIRNVDVLRSRLLEPGEIPVFIITCRTQEVHVYRNAKTNELAAGMEDKVQLVTYAIGITRIPEEVSNPETRGWRIIEMQKSAREWH